MDPGKKLELLAPAKNLECGIAAIRHGADAVYIGAPRFGAREAAGNSIGEISKLAAEARFFGARTYVALNTILYDNELEEAERIIRQVIEAGADALIIQDFGILEMDLPPIALHASTQANNFTPYQLRFLEAVGFKRAVLARELSLNQIEEIAAQTSIELEAFVHGSLCVSLSGQCYMSHAIGGRSANRGACAQPCRKKYALTDATGKIIVKDKHLLSLKDLDRSKSIRELAAAGIRSFKIEGRLKDLDYVKNITAYYREELDRILEGKPGYTPASEGKTTVFFTPDPGKTFHRGATEYYLHGRKDPVASMDSPKSTGEEIGEVTGITRDSFRISGSKTIANNDGLTFINSMGEQTGIKVNRVENRTVYPDKMNGIHTGAKLWRNWDHSFQMALGKKSSERKIPVRLILRATAEGFELQPVAEKEEGAAIRTPLLSFSVIMEKVPANNMEKSKENILRQLAKSGDTNFRVTGIETCGNEQYFFTSLQLNELRRGLLDLLTEWRSSRIPSVNKQNSSSYTADETPYPADSWNFEKNITNRLAARFYRRHGIENPEMGVEKREIEGRLQVMITKHCLQYELGFCARFGGTFPSHLALPFSLKDGNTRFALEFDCKNCMMRIFKEVNSEK